MKLNHSILIASQLTKQRIFTRMVVLFFVLLPLNDLNAQTDSVNQAGGALFPSQTMQRQEFIVYGVYSSLNMGNPGEKTYKDFYINMGAQNGLQVGEKVKVYRRMSTYDLVSKKLQKDVTFPIAELKLIHVESNIAIGRLDQMGDRKTTPVMIPHSIMIGDLVHPL